MRILASFLAAAVYLGVTLHAGEVKGSLSEGEGSSFAPVQGSAFSIKKDLTNLIPDANYDVMIRNTGKVFYQESGEKEDLYLVFNEPVDADDIIKIDVHKGIFLFELSPLNALPKNIVEALKNQVPEQYAKMQSEEKPKAQPQIPIQKPIEAPMERRVIEQPIEQPAQSAIVEPVVASPHTPTPQPVVPSQTMPTPEPKTAVSAPNFPQSITPTPAQEPQPSEEKKGIFGALSQKIDSLFGSKVQTPEVASSAPAISESPSQTLTTPAPSRAPTIQERTLGAQVAERPAGAKRTPDTISSDIEKIKQEGTIGATGKLPPKQIPQSQIETIAKTQKEALPETTKTMTTPVENRELASQSVQAPKNTQEELSKLEVKTPLEKVTPPQSAPIQTGLFKAEVATPEEKPTFTPKQPQSEDVGVRIKEPLPQFETAPKPVEVPQIQTVKAPEVIKPVAPKIEPVPRVEIESKDKIVITKTLTPEQESRVIRRHVEPIADAPEEASTERMSDRVQSRGQGFGGGTISIKAYSNKKSVSAWVEVFKAGTDTRVKTFYTGQGTSLKDIKLPAGVYIVKATYRTASSKQQKSLGEVTLEEGGTIDKSITFDDGTIVMTVKKEGSPLYAKVEVYKKGSGELFEYEFTGRSNGIVTLNLAAGSYDIVIRDLEDERRMSVKVQGGRTQTLNVDF